jgi:hypothetical protein
MKHPCNRNQSAWLWPAVLLFLVALLVEVGANAAPNFPLKVSSDQHHLVDQDNVPFLVNGDTA